MFLTLTFSDKITRFASDGKVDVIYLNFRKVFDIVFWNKGGCYLLDSLNKQKAKKKNNLWVKVSLQ